MAKLRLKASALRLSLTALVGVAVNAQPYDGPQLKELPMAELKAIYLDCDQLASATLLDFQTAMQCSIVSEELLKRGFGGSFEQLLQWWRSTRTQCTQSAPCEAP